MGKSERLHSFCCDTHAHAEKQINALIHAETNTHVLELAPTHKLVTLSHTLPHFSHTHTRTCSLAPWNTRNYHVKLPLYPHTHTLLSNPPTPLCTPCLMSPFTLLYNTPGSLKGTTSHSSFTGPYIHNTIMFARRWPEKKEPRWYTCSSETSVWETSPWRSERTCGSYPMARC